MDDLRVELFGVKESIASAKIRALILYAGLTAGMFLVMARGFKWI